MTKGQPAANRTLEHPERNLRQEMMLPAKVYVVRVIFTVMTLALLAVNDSLCRGQPGAHVLLLLGGLVYPHVGHLAFGRFDISRRRGHILFVIDGLFMGAVIAALQFAMLPGMVLTVVSLFNWMIVGGPALIAIGLTLMFAGALTIGIDFPSLTTGTGATCNASNWMASVILVAYFLIVARIIHQLVGALRLQQVDFQARADSANAARSLAERALLAVLPPGAAQQLATREKLEPELIHGANVLLLQFGPRSQPPSLDEMQTVLQVCNMILTRHGVELVKTFGRQVIAVSRGNSDADEVIKAILELETFFADHHGQDTRRNSPVCFRALLAHGSVTIGLVQPERLNLDLFGDVVEELSSLAALPEQQSGLELLVLPAAFRKLRNSAGFVPLQISESAPPCHIYRPGPLP